MTKNILPLAKKLITIPSVSGDIPQAVAVLEVAKDELQAYEFTPFVSNQFPSLLYSNKGKDIRKFKIILSAHLDVVPGPKNQFKPIEKNGRLYGRGAFDMKSAAAVEILVFKELAHQLSYPLALQLTTDEEPTGEYGTGYQIKQGVRGDFVIIGESNSNFKVTNQSKGRHIVKLTAKGETAHSAYAWFGKNAILKMYEALTPLTKAFPHPKEETFNTTVNIVKIETNNNATNSIPDHCAAYLDIRYRPDDANSILKKIKGLLPKDIKIETNPIRSYHLVDPKNPYLSLLQKETKKIRGEDLPLRFAHATSDAVFFSAVGCDAIEFGPVGEGAHHDNEWVDIKSLDDYYHILKNFLLEVDKNYNNKK